MKHVDEDPRPTWPRMLDGECIHLDTLRLSGFIPGLTDVDTLARLTDVSELKSLSILDASSIPELLGLVNLRSLQIALNEAWLGHQNILDPLTAFLHQSVLLEELDMTGATSIVDNELLEHLGKSLRVLRLHEYESRVGLQCRQVLSRDQLQLLGTQCPKLEELGLDFGYQGEWPYPAFEQISQSCWFLVKLQLYLEIGIADPEHPLQPAATYTTVSHIWDFIWSTMRRTRETHHHVLSQPRLRELQVNAGSFRPDSGQTDWEQTQQQKFRVTACVGEQSCGSPKVISLGAEAKQRGKDYANEYGDPRTAAQRAIHGPSNYPEPDYFGLAMRVAQSLPFPED
ncbi:hypothetical protein ACLMJK_004676 [Lecanora helva]